LKIEYRELIVKDFQRENWDVFHKYRKKVHQQDRPGEHLESNEKIEKRMILPTADDADKERKQYQVFEEGKYNKQIGLFQTVVVKEDSALFTGGNEFVFSFFIEVLKEFRRKGIGRYLLGEIVKIAKGRGRNSLIFHSDLADGKEFMKSIGTKIVYRDSFSRVMIDDIDWHYISKLVDEGNQKSPDSKHVIYNKIPDDIIEDFCVLYDELISQTPDDDLEIGDEMKYSVEQHRKYEQEDDDFSRERVTLVCLEPDGSISGLTEILFDPEEPDKIMTTLTGVKVNYRGHSKGKWMKAKMFEHIRQTFPEVKCIQTNNAHSNEAMLAINKKLGFKEARDRIYGQMSIEEMENVLKL
jgi:GNAT superfamily N-acetyltransferase